MTPDGRLAAFGYQLIEVHHWLRDELAALRADVDAYFDDLDYADDLNGDRGGGTRPRDLRAHCLIFCSALARHHTGENQAAFPKLAEQFPELRPVIEELRRDHRLVEDSMDRLTDLLAGLDREADLVRARRELDSLAALIETHFGYEEKRIVAALNALNMPDWDRSRPGFLRIGDAAER